MADPSPDPEFMPPAPSSGTATATFDPEFSPPPPKANIAAPVAPQMPSDKANAAMDASQKSGFPLGFVYNNMEAVQHAVKMREVDDLQHSSPLTHSQMQDPATLVGSIDDRHNLAAHEAILSEGQPPGIFKRAFRYLTEASPEVLNAEAMNQMTVAAATGKSPEKVTKEDQIAFAREKGAATQPTGKEMSSAAMNAGILLGGGEAALGGKLIAYTGRTALTIGGFEVLNRLIPTDSLIPTDANDATRTAIELADFTIKGAIAGGLSGAIKPVGNFIKAKFADRGINLPEEAQTKIINDAVSKLSKTATPPTAEQSLNTLSNLAQDNKFAQASGEKYGDFVQRMADEYDKGTMQISSDKFAAYFKSKGMNPMEEMSKLGATEADGRLSIPTGKLLSNYAGSEHIGGLGKDLQFKTEAGGIGDFEIGQKPDDLFSQKQLETLLGRTRLPVGQETSPETLENRAIQGSRPLDPSDPTIARLRENVKAPKSEESLGNVRREMGDIVNDEKHFDPKDEVGKKLFHDQLAKASDEELKIPAVNHVEAKLTKMVENLEKIGSKLSPDQAKFQRDSMMREVFKLKDIAPDHEIDGANEEWIHKLNDRHNSKFIPEEKYESPEGMWPAGKNVPPPDPNAVNLLFLHHGDTPVDLDKEPTPEIKEKFPFVKGEKQTHGPGGKKLPLDPVGVEQVKEAKGLMKDHNITNIVSGASERTQQTATIIGKSVPDDRFNGMDLGDTTGMAVKDFKPIVRQALQGWAKDPDSLQGGKKSWRQTQEDWIAAVNDSVKNAKPGETVVLAGSSDFNQWHKLYVENGGKPVFGDMIKRMIDKEDIKGANILPMRVNPKTGLLEALNWPKNSPEAQELATVKEQVKAGGEDPVDNITATKDPIKTFLGISEKESQFTGDIEKDRYRLENANKADRIHAYQIVGKAMGTPEDYEAIYHHNENPNEPLTERQKLIKETEIDPLREATRKAYYALKDKEVPMEPDVYNARIVADRGGTIEKMKAGFKSISEGGLLRKSIGALRSKVMWALEDGEGNRKIVSMKGGDVTEWNNKIPSYLGPERRPPTPKLSEYFDKNVMDKLDRILYDLGIKHERVLKGIRGNVAGVSFEGQNLIKTKFASPESVIFHEIGHQLDDRYDLQKEFVDTPKDLLGKTLKQSPDALKRMRLEHAELKKLADLRWEGQEPSQHFKSYVRQGEEKIAGMFEAYLQAPDKFKEVAPNVYDHFTKFLASKPELQPLLDLKASLVLGKRTIGGPQEPMTFVDKAGKKWDIKPATTKEIEGNTSLAYHKNALVTQLMNYVNMRKVQRSVEFMENLKESPEFNEFATKINTPEYDKLLANDPNSFRESSVPQLRGYVFPNKIANAFDDFYKNRAADGLAATYSKINTVLRNSIFFNPLIHVPNILNHWGVDRGLAALAKPGDYATLGSSTMRAWRAVTTMNQDYMDVLNKGGSLLFSETKLENLSEELLKKAGMELNANKSLLSKIGDELGYANPAKIVKALYDFSAKVTWASNDIATMQRIFERMEHGIPMEEAIEETGKHLPNYRVPSEVLKSRTIATIMRGDSGLTMFGAYHYGALKSYGEMIGTLKDGLTGKASAAEIGHTVDKIAALAVATYVVYPVLDKIAQGITGHPDASVRRSGASTFVDNTQKLLEKSATRKGATSVDVSRYLQSVITPSIGVKAGLEFWFGRDTYNGRPISYGQKLMSYISPIDYARRMYNGNMSSSQFGAGLFGVKIPSRGRKQ